MKKQRDIITSLLFIIGTILFIVGLTYKIPERVFYFSEIEKYVGGDAYNAIIESSIKGGEIAGASACKAIYTCSGLIIVSIGLLRIRPKQIQENI